MTSSGRNILNASITGTVRDREVGDFIDASSIFEDSTISEIIVWSYKTYNMKVLHFNAEEEQHYRNNTPVMFSDFTLLSNASLRGSTDS